MIRKKTLQAVLVLVGLLFTAGIYPLIGAVRETWQANKESAEPMFISLYVALGIFLLLAARNPAANRSLIAYAAWGNLAHAAVMAVMAIHISQRTGLLTGSAVFSAIGIMLLALAPAKGERASTAAA